MKWAARTYLVAALASVTYLLYYISMLRDWDYFFTKKKSPNNVRAFLLLISKTYFFVKNGNPVLEFSLTLYPSGLAQAVSLASLEK